jgi:hypothetical protein
MEVTTGKRSPAAECPMRLVAKRPMLVGEGRREPGMPAPTMTTSAAAGTGCRSTTGSGEYIHQ